MTCRFFVLLILSAVVLAFLLVASSFRPSIAPKHPRPSHVDTRRESDESPVPKPITVWREVAELPVRR